MNKYPGIVLIGFMAAGKTAVGEALASRLECPMIDLDKMISRSEGQSISALIEKKGEAAFRIIESEVLCDVLKENSARVISLGGGAWINERNRILITRAGFLSVWLDASFEVCWQRIISDGGESRPLAGDRVSAENLYLERRRFYALAKLHIDVTAYENAENVANEIVLRHKKELNALVVSQK